MSISDLPTLNAILNFISATLLTLGYINIRRGNRKIHKRFMIAALVTSALFLTSYLIYHFQVGSVGYPFNDWTRPLYFSILVPHVILAATMVPFILMLVYRAFKEDFERHKRLARWIWPIWMFVSISGDIIYGMLYLRG